MQDAILRNIHAVVVELFVKTNEVPFIACYRKEARPRPRPRRAHALLTVSPLPRRARRGAAGAGEAGDAPTFFASRLPILAPGVRLQRAHACEAGRPAAWIADARQGAAATRRSALCRLLAGPAGFLCADRACQSLCSLEQTLRCSASNTHMRACPPSKRARIGHCTAEEGVTGPAALQGRGSARAGPAGLRAVRRAAPGGRAGGGRASVPAEAGPARDHQPR
jgi:hypothetical protein